MRDCRCFGNEIIIISGAAIGLMIYLFFSQMPMRLSCLRYEIRKKCLLLSLLYLANDYFLTLIGLLIRAVYYYQSDQIKQLSAFRWPPVFSLTSPPYKTRKHYVSIITIGVFGWRMYKK